MKFSDEIKTQIEFFNKHLLEGELHLSTYKLIIDNYERLLQLRHQYKAIEDEIQEEVERIKNR
jgi:hypothetical protein